MLASCLAPNSHRQSPDKHPNRHEPKPRRPTGPRPNLRVRLPTVFPRFGSSALSPRSSRPLDFLGVAGVFSCLRQ
eukprot:8794819-Heterocapsa_arctica.AAC.1